MKHANGGGMPPFVVEEERAMKQIILDTDIGNDCDDMGALAMLMNFELEGLCRVPAINSCTAKPYAPSCIRAVEERYGRYHRLGKLGGDFDSETDHYAECVSRKFGVGRQSAEDSVRLYRSCLSEAKDNGITVTAIGPLKGLADLLASEGDDFSPLPGRELVRKKVNKLVVMAGYFGRLRAEDKEFGELVAEWNISLAVEAARVVTAEWDTEIDFCAFELGRQMMTGRNLTAGHPCGYAYRLFNRLRYSWDPCAVYYSVKGANCIFTDRERGTVKIDADGVSRFYPGEGQHRLVKLAVPADIAERTLDSYIR